VDQFCDTLRDRLNALEGGFQSIKTSLQGLPEQAEKALRAKLDEVRTKLQAEKKRIERTRADLQTRAQQKIAETKEAIDEWKAKHETRKLQARADRSEAYAADAVYLAMACIEEAEEAILDAVVARMDADAAH
jgi:peptidoglycan hydrolase CwlO-like protein